MYYFHAAYHCSNFKDPIYSKYFMVDRCNFNHVSIVPHSDHNGAQLMSITLKGKRYTKKIAENCGFCRVCLPVVKSFNAIIKYKGAHRNRIIFRAFYSGAKKSHERFILPNLDALSGCGSIAQYTKRGQDIAFALFLGNIA